MANILLRLYSIGVVHIHDNTYECPAGTGGAYSRMLVVLRYVIFLKKRGFKGALPELTCTERPQPR